MSGSIDDVLGDPSEMAVADDDELAGEPETGMAEDSTLAAQVEAVEDAAHGTDERPEGDEEPNPDGEPPEAAEGQEDGAEPERYEVTVDGETYDVDLDELKAGYSRGRASTKRFQEASAMKKSVQGFVAELQKGDPHMVASLFRKIGVDFGAVAEAYLSEQLHEMQLPPAERGMRELERRRAEFERQQQQAAAQHRESEVQRSVAREQQRLETEMSAAFESHGLQSSPGLVALVAREMEQSLRSDYPMSVADAVRLVVDDMRGQIKTLPKATLSRLLGDEQAAQVRRQAGQQAAAKAKQQRAQVAKAPTQPRPSASEAIRAISTDNMDDLRAFFDGG